MDKLFSGLTVTDNAKQAQMQTMKHLTKMGFVCQSEFHVPDNGNDYPGRIDIVATKGTDRLAIEFDRHSPRKKSIAKLRQMDGYRKIILLRGHTQSNIDDIDGIEIFVIPLREGGECI